MVEYMEFLPFSLAASNSFSETPINVPTPRLGGAYNKYTKMRSATAMVIHAIELELDSVTDLVTASKEIEVQITKQSKTAIVQLNDRDLVKKFHFRQGAAVQGQNDGGDIAYFKFEKPIIVPSQTLFLGQICTTAAGTFYGRIHYTMREVDESDIVRAQIQ